MVSIMMVKTFSQLHSKWFHVSKLCLVPSGPPIKIQVGTCWLSTSSLYWGKRSLLTWLIIGGFHRGCDALIRCLPSVWDADRNTALSRQRPERDDDHDPQVRHLTPHRPFGGAAWGKWRIYSKDSTREDEEKQLRRWKMIRLEEILNTLTSCLLKNAEPCPFRPHRFLSHVLNAQCRWLITSITDVRSTLSLIFTGPSWECRSFWVQKLRVFSGTSSSATRPTD